jgi:hypothetical protein
VPQNVDLAVIRANLEKRVLGPVPLVEHFFDSELMSIESKTDRPLVRLPTGIAIHLHSHSQSAPVSVIISPMLKFRRGASSIPAGDAVLPFKQRKPVPHEFVLDAIASLSPYTRPMFGCLAVYVEDRIVLILRDKREKTADNGVWLATTEEHHGSLRREFPNMRSIEVLRKPVTGWQVLPADAPDFERAALRACELVLAGDPRIGRVPGTRHPAPSSAKARPNSAAKRRPR